MKNIVTLDIGTSGMNASVIDEKGRILFSNNVAYTAMYIQPNLVEQDPNDWYSSSLIVLEKVGEFIKKEKIELEAMAVTSQRASVIPVDREGNYLSNAIMWQDKRSIKISEDMERIMSMEEIYNKTGLRINPYFSLPRILWLKVNEPEIYNKTYKFLGVQDYVVNKLTGEFKTDWSQASRTMLMNITNFKWEDEIIEKFNIDSSKLCEIVAPGAKCGSITEEISVKTNLPKGLPVILAGGDQQNAALALKIIEPRVAEANTGTGSFVIAHSEKPVFDKECRVVCSASAIPGKWIVEAGIFNTGAIYDWYKNEFNSDEVKFEDINAIVEGSPTGANQVMLIPHFQGSAAPYWNPKSKGMLFNLSLGTKKADIGRAILEGIAMEIAENIELIDELIGGIDTVSIAGGLTRFNKFNEIQANCFNKPVITYENTEATSLGAAMNSFVTLGVYSDIQEAFENMSEEIAATFHPVEEKVAIYRKLRVRKNMLYNSLNDTNIFDEFINSI